MKRDEETTSLSTFLATPMGKVMSSGGPEYTPEEVVTMQAADAKAEIPAEQVLVQQVAELNDPNAPDQTKDEWRRRTQLKKSLQEQGLLDSDFIATTKGIGGLVMTIADGVTSPLRYDPRDENGNVIPAKSGLEYVSRYNPLMWPASVSDAINRAPATLNYAGELLEQGYGIMGDGLAGMGGPRYKVKETGAFITEMDRAMYQAKVAQTGGLAGDPSDDTLIKQYAGQGMTLEPVTPEDVEEFEYQQHLRFRGRLKSIEQKRTEGAGPEVVTSSLMTAGAAPLDLLTGSNYMDQVWGKKLPAESQAMIMQMGADPMVWTSFGAGLTRLGVSTAAKGGGARILDAIGKGAQKMARPTEQSLREVQRFQNAVWSKGRVAIYAGGLAGMNYSSLPEPLKNAMNVAAAAYVIHKGGAGTLRWVGDKFPQAAIMLREAADPLNGADIMARQAIAKNTKIPANIRERVAKPSQFVSMESTPARLARNEALSPKTRKMMERLSNFYVVQGVRGASAVATGATKGVIAAAPFAELTRGGGDEEGANLIYGAGTALGGTGGAASRVFGARNRTVARAESDIGRMLVDVQGTVPELQRQGAVKRNQWFDRELNRFLTDVELAGGDIAHMFQARSFDEIARTAAMQGMFRNVDYVPLNDADFALNAEAHGQSGAAGFYLHNPDGARPRLFVNLDARRADVDAHEFGEAFFSSDAFSPEQKAAMRAEVDARYGAEGVTARAREYAEQMIKSENARNFPNETLVVSDEQIRAKMDELAQDELGRGGQDPADWARREIMVEEWRMAGTDYARLRRGVPAGANPVTFVENILGANARALGLSGVRIDPETGQAVTPDQLFKENPVAADDPIVNRNLRAYIKTYNAWLNDPSQEAPSGVKVARDGNVQSFANNPNVDFYSSDPDNPSAPRENTFAVLGPDGRVIEKSPKQRRDERKARNTQVKNMAGRNLLAPGDAAFGLKRRADGRVVASGRRLPQSIILQNHWKPWLPIINTLETLADSGESVQVRYFAAGNSADKVKTAKPTDVVAINREMVFDQWTTNKDGDLLAQFLDLTSMRNRAMRAIGERNPALDPANGGPGYSLQAIMDDVNQWMADKRAGKAGEATIGPDRKNIVNALINPGTAVNRGKNPLAGSMGKGSAIKTLILEGINAVSGTGRKGAAMDYNWANGNFMPDQPPPRPDVDIDLPQERMPSALPQSGMAMPDGPVRGERADIPLNPRARQAAFISDRGEVRATGRATHFETNEDLGPDFLAIGAGHLGEDGFFRFGSQSMDEAMGDSPATSSAAAARYNQSVYDQGKRPSAVLEEPPGLERAAGRGQTGQAMPDTGDTPQPRRYVSMEKFIEEAGDDLGEVLPNAYANIEFNDNDYPTHLVSFADARNSMYRSRVPSKQFFDWLHSDEVMDGLVFDKEYTPARPGEGAGHTRESYQALIDRLREISLKPSKQKATGRTRGQAMPDVAPTLENFDAAQQATGGTLRPIADQPENAPIAGRLTPEQAASIDELNEYYRSVTPQRAKELQADAVESLASRLINKGIPVTEANDMAKATFRTLRSRVNGAMQVISGMGTSDLSRMAGTGRPAVATRKGVNPNWLTSAFEAFDTDNDLALMKAQQVARQLNKEQQAQVAAGQSVDAARASGVRSATIDQGMQFVVGEKTADQKAFGSSLREDPSAPPRVYASVVEGQKFGSQGNYNVFFEWKKDAPMVVTSHHHYGVGNGLTDIHASANIGDKNARSFGDPQAEVYDTLPSGKKVLRTRLLVGNAGAADIRAHQLMVSIPESALSGIRKKGAAGARAELNKIASSQLVGSASQGKTQSFTSKDGVAPMVAIQRNRTEAYVLNPDLKNVASITIVSNSPKETALIKKNLANAFKNNGSPMPRIKVVSAESGPSGNPGRKKITDEFFNLTGKVVYGAALGGAAALAADESQQ